MDDKNFDEKSAKEWIASIESAGAEVRENDIYPRLRTWLHVEEVFEVLDIGCGQGILSSKVISPRHRYTGLEPSGFLLQRARELYENGNKTFVGGNAYALPFANHKFDAAFSVSVWHLLSDIETAAKEMGRVLRPGGKFYLMFAHPEAKEDWLEPGSEDVLYFHSIEQVEQALLAAGLSIEHVDSFRPSRKDPKRNIYLAVKGISPA